MKVACGKCGRPFLAETDTAADVGMCAACLTGVDALMPPGPDPRLVEAVAQMERAVDAVYMNAMSISRLVGLGPADIPRLCVSAGCRMLERMIEAYLERKTAADDGRAEWNLTDRARRQQEIVTAADDLLHTMTDGIRSAQAIQESIGAKVTVQ